MSSEGNTGASSYVVSEEMLNAFIDGELESSDKMELLERLGESPLLTQRACELIRTKELLRSAYSEVEPPPLQQPIPLYPQRRTNRVWGVLAASVVAAVVWWSADVQMPYGEGVARHSAFSAVAFQHAEQVAALKIVFHLTSSNPLRMEKMLDDVERLLQQTGESGTHAVVEVIANGEGLDLYRSGVTSFGERLRGMVEDHQNLRLVACQRTIEQLESGGDGKVRLLPDVTFADSGVSQVIERQQQGWSYIQI